jgi:hypothetical protein
MDTQSIKALLNAKLTDVSAQWSKAVDEEERVTASDYIKVALLEGAMNAISEVIVEIDRLMSKQPQELS